MRGPAPGSDAIHTRHGWLPERGKRRLLLGMWLRQHRVERAVRKELLSGVRQEVGQGCRLVTVVPGASPDRCTLQLGSGSSLVVAAVSARWVALLLEAAARGGVRLVEARDPGPFFALYFETVDGWVLPLLARHVAVV